MVLIASKGSEGCKERNQGRKDRSQGRRKIEAIDGKSGRMRDEDLSNG